ncbi:MAG: PLP-dependent cysteine synthase family protein [Candidatus Bipolaricaulia bacterium]
MSVRSSPSLESPILATEHAEAVRRQVAEILQTHQGSVLHLIGNTPVVKICRLNPYENVTVYAKLEGYNPSGSLKDRIVLYMIADAIERGKLTPGATIVEATSGNTGISVAMVGRTLGHRVLILMPDNVSEERRRMIRAYGARIRLTPGELRTDGAIAAARELSERDGYVWIAQHFNEANSFAHYETTGREILNALGHVDAFVAPSGTTGTLMGVSTRLKESHPETEVISVWPKDYIMGLRRPVGNKKPGIYHESWIDEIIEIEDKEAKWAARRIGRKEGLLVGPSAGAAFLGALRLAERYSESKSNEERTIVVLFPDGGDRYLSTNTFKW